MTRIGCVCHYPPEQTTNNARFGPGIMTVTGYIVALRASNEHSILDDLQLNYHNHMSQLESAPSIQSSQAEVWYLKDILFGPPGEAKKPFKIITQNFNG